MRRKKRCPLYPNSDRKSDFPEKAMSALPPKADICSAPTHVRFGPEADIPSIQSVHLHDIVWLPSLVEELDTGTVEAQRHQKIPTVGCLDPVRLWRTGWLRR